MNVVDELARLGIALNAEQAAAWKGIKVPKRPDPDECEDCAGTGKESRVEWVSGCERDFEAPCCTCEGAGQLPDEPIPGSDDLVGPWPTVCPPNPPRAETGD